MCGRSDISANQFQVQCPFLCSTASSQAQAGRHLGERQCWLFASLPTLEPLGKLRATFFSLLVGDSYTGLWGEGARAPPVCMGTGGLCHQSPQDRLKPRMLTGRATSQVPQWDNIRSAGHAGEPGSWYSTCSVTLFATKSTVSAAGLQFSYL